MGVRDHTKRVCLIRLGHVSTRLASIGIFFSNSSPLTQHLLHGRITYENVLVWAAPLAKIDHTFR